MAITLPFVEAAATYYGEDEYDLEDDEQAEAALAVMKSRQIGAKRRAEIDATKELIAALEGKPQPEPGDTHGLMPLLEAWIKESNPKQDTVRMARYRLGRFADIVGRELGPRQITRAHVQKYRDHLHADAKLKRSTKAKFLELLTTLFNVGMSVGLVDSNPALKVKLPREKTYELGKQPFNGAQVALIFEKMVEDKQTTDFCWKIRLLAYHGCRSGELAQIRCADVTKIAGVTVMRLYGDIKNPESVRDVPLHPACEDFVSCAQKRARTGERVFQSFPSWKGRYGEKFQKDANFGCVPSV